MRFEMCGVYGGAMNDPCTVYSVREKDGVDTVVTQAMETQLHHAVNSQSGHFRGLLRLTPQKCMAINPHT